MWAQLTETTIDSRRGKLAFALLGAILPTTESHAPTARDRPARRPLRTRRRRNGLRVGGNRRRTSRDARALPRSLRRALHGRLHAADLRGERRRLAARGRGQDLRDPSPRRGGPGSPAAPGREVRAPRDAIR